MTDALVPSRTILRMCMLKKASYTSVQCLFLVLMLLRSILSLSSTTVILYPSARAGLQGRLIHFDLKL